MRGTRSTWPRSRDAWSNWRRRSTSVSPVWPLRSVTEQSSTAGASSAPTAPTSVRHAALHAGRSRDRAPAIGARHGVSAVVFSASTRGCRDDVPTVELFLQRAETAARLARDLPDAPTHPAGKLPAGHRLRAGQGTGPRGVRSRRRGRRLPLVDPGARRAVSASASTSAPTTSRSSTNRSEGDHAWQPFSANGVPRERAVAGRPRTRCSDGLSDPWSAEPGGVRLTGAARAESFHHAPQPRMSNIRIEVDDPLPAPGEFEDYGPEQVRDLLRPGRRVPAAPAGGLPLGLQRRPGQHRHGRLRLQLQGDLRPDRRRGRAATSRRSSPGRCSARCESVREAFGPLQARCHRATAASGARACRRAAEATTSWCSTRTPRCGSGGADVDLEPLARCRCAACRPDGVAIRRLVGSSSPSRRRLSPGHQGPRGGQRPRPADASPTAGGARYLLIWEDGRVSRGHLERRQLEHEPAKRAWRSPARRLRRSRRGPGARPRELPRRRAARPARGDVVARRTARRWSTPGVGPRARVDEHGVRTWSGSFSAAEGEPAAGHLRGTRRVAARAPPRAGTSRSTARSATVSARGGSSRESEFESRLDRLLETSRTARDRSRPHAGRPAPVILHPRVVESYVLDTLLNNLDGAPSPTARVTSARAVRLGRRRVLREDLTLRLDPLRADEERFLPVHARGTAGRALHLHRARAAGAAGARPQVRPAAGPAAHPPLPPPGHAAPRRSAADFRWTRRCDGPATAPWCSPCSESTPRTAPAATSRCRPRRRCGSTAAEFAGSCKATISGNLFDLLRSDTPGDWSTSRANTRPGLAASTADSDPGK